MLYSWAQGCRSSSGRRVGPRCRRTRSHPICGRIRGLETLEERRLLAWQAAAVDTLGNVGWYTSLAIVDGHPAIGYYDSTNFDLKFVRANDPKGASWGTPVSVDTSGNVGEYASLAIVDGQPAISYYDGTNGDLKFVRASDPAGATWADPVTIDADGLVGLFTSLAVVDGRPAISYHDNTGRDLKYARATDARGTNWDLPIHLDTVGNVGWDTSLAIVDGTPAISYYDFTNGNLKYIRATDASGTNWAAPIAVDAAGDLGQYTSLAVVDGRPAISYLDNTNGDLKFVRAADAAGASWTTPLRLDTAGNVGWDTSLAIVGGNPAISYFDFTNGNLEYIRASDATGANWAAPISLDAAGIVGQFTSLAVMDGQSAISYFDSTGGDLKYAVFTNTSPIITTPIPDQTAAFGAANHTLSVFPHFADAETADHELTYTIVGNTNPEVVLALTASATGELTLDFGSVGTSEITIQATDPEGLAATENFTVSVVDDQVPVVTDVTPSLERITDADIGAGRFTVTLDFSEPMDTAIAPMIAFAPDVTSTLSLASGMWSTGGMRYTANYDVSDANVAISGVDISISGARDVAGNPQSAANILDRFEIDTLVGASFVVTPEAVNEAQSVTLTGSFNSSAPVNTVRIVWGDGQGRTFTLPAGHQTFSASHIYLDDPFGTLHDTFLMAVHVLDENGQSLAEHSQPVRIMNVAPIFTSLILSPTSVPSGGSALLTGTFSDPGPFDALVLDVDLDGDGTFDHVGLPVAGGAFQFDFPFDQPPGTHPVNVRIRDDDGGSTTIARQITIMPTGQTVEAVHLFYNNSAYDGNGPEVTAADFAAIAPDKFPLAFGETATFANISGFLRGIIGIFIDVPSLPDDGMAVDASDFLFAVGNSNFPDTWTAAASPTAVGVLADAGPAGSDRIYITFADGAIQDTWLRVTVKANADTNLAAGEDFFFGNVRGDTGAAFLGQGLFFGREAADLLSVSRGLFQPAGVASPNDVNRDGVVNAFDLQAIPLASGGGVNPNVINAIAPERPAAGTLSAWIASLAIDQAIADDWDGDLWPGLHDEALAAGSW